MKVEKIIAQTIQKVTPDMHATRRLALSACVSSILGGNPVSVTRIGRGISSTVEEKHKIKRADRLCSNRLLQSECPEIYRTIISQFGHLSTTPVILVDWSDLDDRQENFLLRASIAIDGRAVSIYQEAHTLKTRDKPGTHRQFLAQLKAMFADTVKPVIVTDAGFRCPWFQQVREMGWDFVGRVGNRTQYQLEPESDWTPIKTLYGKATRTPTVIGAAALAKANPTPVTLVLYKKKPQGRHKLTRRGTTAQWTNSKLAAEREREPWLLAASLKSSHALAKRVVKIYGSRMQVEQTFRDTKNIHYGIGLGVNRTRAIERLSVLLLLAAIASLILLLLGLLAEEQGLHKKYQANTVKSRRVLSLHYLGLRICQNKNIRFLKKDWERIIIQLKYYACSFEEKAFL